jgi:hypothetical protein
LRIVDFLRFSRRAVYQTREIDHWIVRCLQCSGVLPVKIFAHGNIFQFGSGDELDGPIMR